MENKHHKLHRHPRYEHRLNLTADKCIVDAQFSTLFRGDIEPIETDDAHIIVSCKELEDVLFFLNIQHEMNDITNGFVSGSIDQSYTHFQVQSTQGTRMLNVNTRYFCTPDAPYTPNDDAGGCTKDTFPTVTDKSSFILGENELMDSLFRFINWRSFSKFVSCLKELRRGPGIDALVGLKDGEVHVFVTSPLNEIDIEELRGMGCKIAEVCELRKDYPDKRMMLHANSTIMTAINKYELKINKMFPLPENRQTDRKGELDDFYISLLMIEEGAKFSYDYMGSFRPFGNEEDINKDKTIEL